MTQKNDGKLLVILIIAIIGFGIGVCYGISVTMNLDQDDNATNETQIRHVENVTEEMTTNLTDDTQDQNILDDEDIQDFNENKTFTYGNDSYDLTESK